MNKAYRLLVFLFVTALPVSQVAAQAYSVPANTPAHIKRAVELSSRSEEQRARDAGRKPAEVLTVADLNEGDHIAELSTFGQYYTPMLLEAVGPSGKVDMYDLPVLAAFQDGNVGKAGQAFADRYPNAEYHIADYGVVEYPSGLDAVYNILSYHDMEAMGVDAAKLNSRVYAGLRAGGKYVIVDHRAADGSGRRDSGTIHRIDKQLVISEVTNAGFELIADRDFLANPDDDHTVMVFGMRGDTDRMVLIFQKP